MKTRNSILSITLAIGFAILVAACGNNQKQEQSTTSPTEQNAEEATLRSTEIIKEQAQKILSAYLEVKNALVQTDGKKASAAATTLVKALGENQDALISKIRSNASHIAATENASQQREHFNTLSNHVYEVVKATNAHEAILYRQFCPMAMNNNGAYWLSTKKEINNPYFGEKMLHCGSVKETL